MLDPTPEPIIQPAADQEETQPVRDWSMIVIMLAIIAALGFGGAAMMYRRAEASKRQAEAAHAQAQLARNDAEQARKEALVQRRLAEELRAKLNESAAAEADARARTLAAEQERGAPPAAASDTARPQLIPVDPTLPVAPDDMRAVLDAAAKELESGSIKDNPAAAGAVHSTLGHTYLSLGEHAKAATHLRRAIDLRTPVLGENSPEVTRDRAALDRAEKARKP